MAYDGIVTKAVADECSRLLETGRIAKIYQPADSDIVLQIRVGKENRRLLLSANLTFPRVHLTGETYSNPLEAPMFCMLMRKHCEGAVIESIRQVDMERILHINVRTRDELGDWKLRRIIVEIMGRHSNILLVDPQKNIILDGIHHVTPGMSRHRTVLPGREYTSPPEQHKKNPLEITRDEFISGFDYNAGRLDKQIVERFTGISPLVAREITARGGLGSREGLWTAFNEIMQNAAVGNWEPQIVRTDTKSYFSAIRLTHLQGETEAYSSISECLEAFFYGKSERDAVRQKANDLIRFAANELEKNQKKLIKLEASRVEAEEADLYRLYGELLTAYMHQLKKGDTVAEMINYYEEDSSLLQIPLDPLKTPAENAQSYYRKYNKAKSSLAYIAEQMDLAKEEASYFENILQQLEGASLADISEIREELVEGGYLRHRGKKDPRKKKDTRPAPEKYLSSEGTEILVGKNNRQNDYLTNRLASPNEIWLHTKDIPGSHVVIRSASPSEATLLEAAAIAAYFSKARGSNQIPVDYTAVRHVRKPAGAKPGFVIYDHQKTIYTSSDEQLVRRLKQ